MKTNLVYKIEKSNDWYTIQKVAIEAGLESGDLGNVIQGWVAKVKGEIIGGVMFLKSKNDYSIEWLSVTKKYRDHGIGSSLVNEVIKFAKKNGCKRIIISMQIPEFFKKFGFEYDTARTIPKEFLCFDCPRYNKSCFPLVMTLDFKRVKFPIEIKEIKEYPLIEKLALEQGQEVSREITRRVEKAWFAYRENRVIGGIGIFKWRKDYSLEYYFATENIEIVQENLMKYVLLYAQKKNIKTLYLIRGAPEYMFSTKRFGFKQIHFRDLPPDYRNFTFNMCDSCPKERKAVCNPVAMMLRIGKPLKYILNK
jgi:N-acetylglutamate synthase-like GNAT family acetyltransferase